jgi:hypothetical protein
MTTEATLEKEKPVKVKPVYVTAEEFKSMNETVISTLKALSDSIVELKTKTATPTEVKEVKDVAKAGPDQQPMNPSWDEKAREIIGEAVDHCYVVMPKGGGTIFTIVIKPEFSNAPQSYMEMYKIDRRTREIGAEGIAGVETLAKLVKQNLKQNARVK